MTKMKINIIKNIKLVLMIMLLFVLIAGNKVSAATITRSDTTKLSSGDTTTVSITGFGGKSVTLIEATSTDFSIKNTIDYSTDPIVLTLKYSGNGNTFNAKITYGDSSTENITLAISTNPDKETVYKYISSDDDDDDDMPSIVIKAKDGEDLNVTPGQSLDLQVTIKNNSSVKAKNIVTTVEFDNDIFSYEKYLGNIETSLLYGNKSKDISINLLVNENAKKGIQAITFKSKYTNANGTSTSSEDTIYLNVTKSLLEPSLEFTNAVATPYISLSTPFSLALTVTNNGGITAKNIKVEIKDLGNDTFIPTEISSDKHIDTISPKESKTVTFNLKAGSNNTSQNQILTLLLSYYDESNKEYNEEKNIYLTCANNDEDGESENAKPKIVISSYSASKNPIKSGDKFNFAYSFTNTSSTKKMKNVKMTIELSDGTFNLAKGTSSYWISTINPKETITKVIELKAKNDAVSGSYPVTIDFEYEDAKGTEYTSKEDIYLQVVENVKFSIGDIETPYEAFLDTPADLSFTLYNKGKSEISNINVEVTGDIKSEDETNYLGNLSSGKDDYYDISIIPLKEGTVNGTLIFIYEDTNGDESTFVQDIKFDVSTSEDIYIPDDIDIDIVEEEKGLSRWIEILLVIIEILIVTFISKNIFIKRYNKKIEEDV